MLVNALLLGLGIMKLCEILKERVALRARPPFALSAWSKSLITGVLAGLGALGAVIYFHEGWFSGMLIGLGAWGVSALGHAFDTHYRAGATYAKIEVMKRGRR